jgi:hypothetical protein
MRALLTMACVITLTSLPLVAEAGMGHSGGGSTAPAIRMHMQQHRHVIARFRNRFLGNPNNFNNNFNNGGFFGDFNGAFGDLGDYGYGNGYYGNGYAPPIEAQYPAPPPMPRMPRPVSDARATVTEENGVTVFRGPGSRHIAP